MDLMKLGVLAVLFVGLFAVPLVLAAPDGSAVTNIAGASTGSDGTDTNAAGTQGVNAGNVYHLDLQANSTTNYWAGVWGNVSGSVELRDNAGAIFFTKNFNIAKNANPAKGVYSMVFAYALQDSVPNFGNLNVNLRTGGDIDAVTGVSTTQTDSATNLFSSNWNTFMQQTILVVGNKTVNVNTANSAFCGRVYNASSGALTDGDCQYVTLSMNDGSNNLLFASSVVHPYGPTNWKIYDNATYANYQMPLYVNNSGNSNAQNYEFFLELR